MQTFTRDFFTRIIYRKIGLFACKFDRKLYSEDLKDIFYIQLLIFPEGTNLTDKTKTKSNDYAAKQKIYNRPYDYCLHPHLTGFTYLLNIMRSG